MSYYIESKNIKMYPSGYRGLTSNTGNSNQPKKSYNPESKLNVEANAVRSLKTLINFAQKPSTASEVIVKNYGDLVITEDYNWNDVPGGSSYNYVNFEFICNGYYFKIIDSRKAFESILQSSPNQIYVKLLFSDMNIRVPLSTQDSTADNENTCITEKHLANLKKGTDSGALTATLLDNSEGNIIDYTSLDENITINDVSNDYFTGIELVTEINSEDPSNYDYHYFKILEKDTSVFGNYIVPQEAKLITDTNHISGGKDSRKVKCLHDLLETRKIKSHSAEGLEIKSEGDLNIDVTNNDVSITSNDVIIQKTFNNKTEIKGNEITTTDIKGYTNLTLTCETAGSTLTLKSPKVQLVNDNTKLLVEYTPDKFSIKKQTSGSNYLNFTNDNGFIIADSDTSASSQIKITNDKIEVWGEDVTTTKIYKDEIQTEDICLTNQKPASGSNALEINSNGYVSKVALSATHTTPSTTQLVDYVDGITQAANGAITYTTSTLPIIGKTSNPPTLKGLAQVDNLGSYYDDNAHYRYILTTYNPSEGGKLFVQDVNTVLETMVAGNEYPLIARKEVEGDYGWFKTGCYNGSIRANSNGRLTAVSFYATSDERLKENIKPLKYTKSILDLPVYTYDYINGQKNNIGCLAQDLQKLYPQLVSQNSDGYLMVDNSKVVYLLLEEVKLLKKELNEIKAKLK